MIHPIQYLNRESRKIAADNGCSISEAAENMDEQNCLECWLEESLKWMKAGRMRKAWWNAVVNNKTANALISNWLKHHPGESAIHGHDMDYALAIVRHNKTK